MASERIENEARETGARETGAPATAATLMDRVQAMVVPDRNASRVSGDSARRTRRSVLECSLPPRDHPLPVPNGWYAVVAGTELGIGDIVSFRAVGRDVVAYRDRDGAAHVLDAHCPHLGAHLGGGRVVGDRLACPYHGWEFGPTGRCVEIPYCDARIPTRARVRSYPVVEQNGFVYFWYHAADSPPTYALPEVAEVTDPDWTDAHPWQTDLVAALQEMAENNVDYAHLRFVHRREEVPGDISEFTTDGPFSTVVESIPNGPPFARTSYGPGVALLRVPDLMTLVANTTPIDRGTCRLQWHFFFPAALAGEADVIIDGVTGMQGLQADIPIWRDKVYRDRPVLVKGDGPIAEFRHWYSQFYEGS